jgi:hypothetical protein
VLAAVRDVRSFLGAVQMLRTEQTKTNFILTFINRRKKMETRKTKAKVLVSLLALVGLLGLLQADVAALEGPAQSPPLGVSVVDSDPGGPDDKEQWGREGGRTFTFTIFQVDEYDQLKWQPIEVGIAFDGAIDAAGEILTFDSMGVGTAVWIGDTEVEVLDENTNTYETVTVNTEFILTVKDGNDSLVPLVLMNGIPTVDINTLTPTGLFTAKLEMRAQMPSYDSVTAICPYASPTVGEYYPALDVFDCLQTNPAYDRPAISMFEYGFFYELSTECDLCEHATYMEGLVGDVQDSVDDIYMWTDFLYEDWPLRMDGINDAHEGINANIAAVEGKVDHVDTMVDAISADVGNCADQDSVDDIKDIVKLDPDWHLLMFGLEDFIQDPVLKTYVPAVLAMSPLYQKLDYINETCTQMSTQMQQYAGIIESLTTQLEAANQQIADLTADMGSMYTQEELDQAIADASPGNSEYPGQGPPEKNK